MKPHILPMLMAGVLLPGCIAPRTPDSCGAERFMELIGQSGEIARHLNLDQPVRVISPGTIVTRDYRPNRINFALDESGGITVVRCG